MKSVRSTTKEYNRLLLDVETKDFYKTDLSNRVNCYTCPVCSHITKTKDIDSGVTPMFFACEKCGRSSGSSFYKDISPNQMPTIEWYRPTLQQVLKMRNNIQLLYHILNGGLEYRRIKNDMKTDKS